MALNGVLLFGAGGQLGHELHQRLHALGEVSALTRADIDLADLQALRACVWRHQPRWIVNAAAYTAVDRAEQENDLAQSINAHAPGVMAEVAAQLGAGLVHYSTDYVFNGRAQYPYTEDDVPDPQSVYGRTKRHGELALQASGARHLTLRSSWVVGAHGQNFLKTMLRLGQERDTLRVVADQVGVPTGAAWMAAITVQAMQLSDRDGLSGLFHLTPAGETSWHGYAHYLFQQARAIGWHLKVTEVQAIRTDEYPLPAVRPAYSLLDSSRLVKALDIELPPWQQGVDAVLQALRQA
ncbi:MAG: dTDP-4-dehydrorhamnose reductase [Betaproteobacteria bacterium]|nr:dTDP-4-dehydrorhamnose reductase [Betaproteobacteria bacterium]